MLLEKSSNRDQKGPHGMRDREQKGWRKISGKPIPTWRLLIKGVGAGTGLASLFSPYCHSVSRCHREPWHSGSVGLKLCPLDYSKSSERPVSRPHAHFTSLSVLLLSPHCGDYQDLPKCCGSKGASSIALLCLTVLMLSFLPHHT